MRGLIVSVVDVLGIFVPGFLIMMTIVIVPPVWRELIDLKTAHTLVFSLLRENIWLAGLCVLVSWFSVCAIAGLVKLINLSARR